MDNFLLEDGFLGELYSDRKSSHWGSIVGSFNNLNELIQNRLQKDFNLKDISVGIVNYGECTVFDVRFSDFSFDLYVHVMGHIDLSDEACFFYGKFPKLIYKNIDKFRGDERELYISYKDLREILLMERFYG